ncbi:MAG: hypothetical protein HY716_01320 [Planctomycetes bacterium]|nr:hypothetical protein [Planctomycetota bacterium]
MRNALFIQEGLDELSGLNVFDEKTLAEIAERIQGDEFTESLCFLYHLPNEGCRHTNLISVGASAPDPDAQRYAISLAQSMVGAKWIRLDLKMRRSWARGEPVLWHDWYAIRSFEHFARRWEWSIATKCIASGNEEDARAFYKVIQSARGQMPRPLNWLPYESRDQTLILMILTPGRTLLYRPGPQGIVFKDAVAMARIVQDDRAKGYRIAEVVAGNAWDSDER